jgi:hypothetical protein
MSRPLVAEDGTFLFEHDLRVPVKSGEPRKALHWTCGGCGESHVRAETHGLRLISGSSVSFVECPCGERTRVEHIVED